MTTAALGLIKPPSATPSPDTTTDNNKDQLLKALLSPNNDQSSSNAAAMELDAEGAALSMLLELAKGQRILARALAALPPQQVGGVRLLGGVGGVRLTWADQGWPDRGFIHHRPRTTPPHGR